jgi:hypothetical protein
MLCQVLFVISFTYNVTYYFRTVSLLYHLISLYVIIILFNPDQNGVPALLIKNGLHLSDLSGSDQSEGKIIYPILYRCCML